MAITILVVAFNIVTHAQWDYLQMQENYISGFPNKFPGQKSNK